MEDEGTCQNSEVVQVLTLLSDRSRMLIFGGSRLIPLKSEVDGEKSGGRRSAKDTT